MLRALVRRGIASNNSITYLDLSCNGIGAAQNSQPYAISLAVEGLCGALRQNRVLKKVSIALPLIASLQLKEYVCRFS